MNEEDIYSVSLNRDITDNTPEKDEESLFTVGITIHDATKKVYEFKDCLESVLESYRNISKKDRLPIDIMISIDSAPKEGVLDAETTEKIRKDFDKRIEEATSEEEREKIEKEKEYWIEGTKANHAKEIEEYIKWFKEEAEKRGYKLNINTIRNEENYGKVSTSRNRITELCRTEYVTFFDGDDYMNEEVLSIVQEECINSNKEAPEPRTKYGSRKNSDIIKGKADVIYINSSGMYSKRSYGNIYNVQSLIENKINFAKLVGSEDGYFKQEVLQKGLKVAISRREIAVEKIDKDGDVIGDRSVIDGYTPQGSTEGNKNDNFKSVIQLVNRLNRHRGYGVDGGKLYLYDEEHINKLPERDPYFSTSYNSIFQYFNSGLYFGGYGFLFCGNIKGEICIPQKPENPEKIEELKEYESNVRNIAYVISSLILYPDILKDKKDMEFFKKVREIVESNREIPITDALKKAGEFKKNNNISSYDEIIDKIKNNFIERCQEIVVDIIKNGDIDTILSQNDKKIFNDTLLLDPSKNPHLLGDDSRNATIVDFDKFFSKEAFEAKSEKVQEILMNKILKGKFVTKGMLENNPTNELNPYYRSKMIIEYFYSKDKEFFPKLITKTKFYLKNRDFVDNILEKCEKNEQNISSVKDKIIKGIKLQSIVQKTFAERWKDEQKKQKEGGQQQLDTL